MSERERSDLTLRLRALTPARVGLGKTGVSQHSRDVLAFQLCHAQARDAVHSSLDSVGLTTSIAAITSERGCAIPLRLHSAAKDRSLYLQRPDLGRRLDDTSRRLLGACASDGEDLVIVVADGLSATAVLQHVPPLLMELLPSLGRWSLAPFCVVEQGRVAIGDEIGELLGARLALMLIGERPGLSSPDSLGAYLTWDPRVGTTDAERICISNIRAEGLSYVQAARQLGAALAEAMRCKLTGVSTQSGARLGKGAEA